MFIAHKNNVIQNVHEMEWQCRMVAKSFNDTSDYWTWLATITTQDSDGNDVITYPSETFIIVEVTDEDVLARLGQLSDYVKPVVVTGDIYNIKYYTAKRNAEEIKDFEGNSHSPKQYVSSHFVGDNTAKDARLLADKWVAVRRDRNSRLAETDYLALSDNTVSGDMQLYRQKLRDVPADNADVDDISWPTKP